MKNKDTIKELAVLCKMYANEIMQNTDAEDECLTYLAWEINANANDIIEELKK